MRCRYPVTRESQLKVSKWLGERPHGRERVGARYALALVSGGLIRHRTLRLSRTKKPAIMAGFVEPGGAFVRGQC